MMNRVIENFSTHSPFLISIYVTLFVLSGSIPAVYLFSYLLYIDYTFSIFLLSVALPILLTPPVIMIILNLAKHLKYFQDELKKEIENNKKTDILLFEQARFVLMGEMMANISHQWKQPLNTMGLAVVNIRTSEEQKETEYLFDVIEDNIGYLASTIDDFMSFFDNKHHLEMQDLDSIVREVKSIVYTHISNKNIHLEIGINKEYANIEVASSISQVILNLLNNAKDAFPKENKEAHITMSLTATVNGLHIECCDNGGGIKQAIQEKVFDPYFTTKEKKQGAGIGLYMSKEIVQKIFDGKINLMSKEGEGSCFYISIPYSSNCILKKEKL